MVNQMSSSWVDQVSRLRDSIIFPDVDDEKKSFEQTLFRQIFASKGIDEVLIKHADGSIAFYQSDGTWKEHNQALKWESDAKHLDLDAPKHLFKLIGKEEVIYQEERCMLMLFRMVNRPDEESSRIKALIEEAQIRRWRGDYEGYYDIIMMLEEEGIPQDQFYRYLDANHRP